MALKPLDIDSMSDFIDPMHFARALKRYWKSFFIVVCISLVLALCLYKALPPRWHAEATLKIGQILSTEVVADERAILVEPVAQAAERIKLQSFRDTLLLVDNNPARFNARSVSLIQKTLSAVPIKNTNLLRITLDAASSHDAKEAVNAAAALIIHEHRQLLEPTLKRLKNRADVLELQIEDQKKEMVFLKKAFGSNSVEIKKDFLQFVIIGNMLNEHAEELRKLESEHADIENLLEPSQTFYTHLVDPVSSDVNPSFPRFSIILLMGLFVGSLLGLIIAVFKSRSRDH